MAEWKKRKGRGDCVYFDGKWCIMLGDPYFKNNTLLRSAVVWDDRGVLEIYVRMTESVPAEPIESAKRVARRFKEYFGASKVVADVSDSYVKKGMSTYRVSAYMRLDQRPDASKFDDIRGLIRECVVEPEFIGETKDGEVQCVYTYSELPYGSLDKCLIRMYAYEHAQGKKNKQVKGLYWRLSS